MYAGYLMKQKYMLSMGLNKHKKNMQKDLRPNKGTLKQEGYS